MPSKYTDPEVIVELYQLMKDTHKLFTTHGISYWLDAGSLLGALRYKGIIPWDDDLDIGILESDLSKVLELEPQFNKLGYHLEKIFWGYKIRAPHADLDIFLFRKENEKYIYAHKKIRTVYAKRDGGPICYTEEEL